jgi:hypothetical protein
MGNILSGFKVAGIFQPERGVFSEHDSVVSHDRLLLEKVQCLVLPAMSCEAAAGASPEADLSTTGHSPDT